MMFKRLFLYAVDMCAAIEWSITKRGLYCIILPNLYIIYHMHKHQSNKDHYHVILISSQTVHTFSLHYADMLRKTGRRIIVPEMRCQGKTELLSKHGTMKQHVADFVNLCNKLKVWLVV